MQLLPITALEAGLERVEGSPADDGVVELIVRRPRENEREALTEGTLDLVEGLVSDDWRARGSGSTPDGRANPEAQVTLMNVRAAALVAGDPERRSLAGDQFYVDLDLSVDNLPPGSRIRLGTAVVEISAKPHTGCAKFSARFGADALRFVNSPVGRAMRLRGVNAKVVSAGSVRVGDAVGKAPAPSKV